MSPLGRHWVCLRLYLIACDCLDRPVCHPWNQQNINRYIGQTNVNCSVIFVVERTVICAQTNLSMFCSFRFVAFINAYYFAASLSFFGVDIFRVAFLIQSGLRTFRSVFPQLNIWGELSLDSFERVRKREEAEKKIMCVVYAGSAKPNAPRAQVIQFHKHSANVLLTF